MYSIATTAKCLWTLNFLGTQTSFMYVCSRGEQMVERLSHRTGALCYWKRWRKGGTIENNELVTPHGLSFSGSVLAQRKEWLAFQTRREMLDSSKVTAKKLELSRKRPSLSKHWNLHTQESWLQPEKSYVWYTIVLFHYVVLILYTNL